MKQSARNRMRGIVTRVVRDTVMAQVEMQAGPFRIVSLMSREAADDLGLEPGVLAVAAVKSTNVVVEIPELAREEPGRCAADRLRPAPARSRRLRRVGRRPAGRPSAAGPDRPASATGRR